MQAADRGGIFVAPEALGGNKVAQEFFLITFMFSLITDRPLWCLNDTDGETFRGRRMIIGGFYGNDVAEAKHHWNLLKAYDDFGVMSNFESLSVRSELLSPFS